MIISIYIQWMDWITTKPRGCRLLSKGVREFRNFHGILEFFRICQFLGGLFESTTPRKKNVWKCFVLLNYLHFPWPAVEIYREQFKCLCCLFRSPSKSRWSFDPWKQSTRPFYQSTKFVNFSWPINCSKSLNLGFLRVFKKHDFCSNYVGVWIHHVKCVKITEVK